MRRMTNVEFLNFLYEEKNRAIQNVLVPGWSTWAIYSAMLSVGLYLLNLLIDANFNISLNLCVRYFLQIICVVLSLTYLLVRPFIKIPQTFYVKYLQDEAPWRSYLIQFFLSVICAGLQYYYVGFDWAFAIWYLVVVLIGILLLYVLSNRKQIVRSSNGFQVFKNDVLDGAMQIGISLLYVLLSVLCRVNLPMGIVEFQVALGIALGIFLLLLLIKITYIGPRFANNIDMIIDDFMESRYTQEEAYAQYQRAKYGLDVFQVTEEERQMLDTFISEYEIRKKAFIEVIEKAKNEQVSVLQAKELVPKFADDTAYYEKLLDTNVSLLEKLEQIIELNPPRDVQQGILKIIKKIKKIKKVVPLVKDLISIARQAQDAILTQSIFDTKNYCRKYGTVCPVENCVYRNDRMSILCKLKCLIHKICNFF